MGYVVVQTETQLALQVDALVALDRRANQLEGELVQMQNQVVRRPRAPQRHQTPPNLVNI